MGKDLGMGQLREDLSKVWVFQDADHGKQPGDWVDGNLRDVLRPMSLLKRVGCYTPSRTVPEHRKDKPYHEAIGQAKVQRI